MNQSLYKILLVIILGSLLSACASPNVPLKPTFWQERPKVKVANDKLPQPVLYHMGQQGILDYVISDAVTKDFNHYLHNFDLNKLVSLRKDFVKRLRANNIPATKFATINVKKLPWVNKKKQEFSERNFSQFSTKIGNSRLLVVSTNLLGAIRNYYAMIPLGPPRAICELEGRLVNIKNNRVLWRYTSRIELPVKGYWSQPPAYPNFTNALNEAIEVSRTQLMDNFFSSKPD